MNLFCISLEGSMDSLYEPVSAPSRPCSSTVSQDKIPRWRCSERPVSMDFSQFHNSTSKKKKKKRLMPTSASDSKAADSADHNNTYWQPSHRGHLPVVLIRNSLNEGMGKTSLYADPEAGKDRACQPPSERKMKEQTAEVVRFQAWNPKHCPVYKEQDLVGPQRRHRILLYAASQYLSDGMQHQSGAYSRPQRSSGYNMAQMAEKHLSRPMPVKDARGKETDVRRSVKVVQKSPRVKRNHESARKSRTLIKSNCHSGGGKLARSSPMSFCLSAAKRGDKKLCKDRPERAQENLALVAGLRWSTSATHSQCWSSPSCGAPMWISPHYACRPAPAEQYLYACDTTFLHERDWEPRGGSGLQRDRPTACVVRSVTELELCRCGAMLQRKPSNVSDKPKSNKAKRSTSFGKFEAFRHQTNKPEEHGGAVADSREPGSESSAQTKPASLSKKMRAISLTMRKKMYKKAKAGESVEGTESDHEEEEDARLPPEEEHQKANSAESLYSGQSSSSGVTSSSNGSSNRDSLRLEDETPYTGHFCGKARVHTDFVPSPYDSDSLKLKVGDVIDIISKPPMGIWTGLLNNKVGTFKFIYVDLLEEKEPEMPKIRPHRRSKRPRPKTLQELLERLHLEEYTSMLLLNGYQTVEDLKELKEKHLEELNITDPEHRERLLAAAERLQDTEYDHHTGNEDAPYAAHGSPKLEHGEYPRDSGCYLSSECSDNGRDDTDSQQESQPPTIDS